MGNIAFGYFFSTSKAVFYIKHNIRNVQDDKERLETKRNCIKRSEFTFENQLFPVVLPTSSFWWELVVVQLDRTTWKRGDAQNGCAVRKIADLVLELVLVVDANILYYKLHKSSNSNSRGWVLHKRVQSICIMYTYRNLKEKNNVLEGEKKTFLRRAWGAQHKRESFSAAIDGWKTFFQFHNFLLQMTHSSKIQSCSG